MQPTNQLQTKNQLQLVNLQTLPNCRIAINHPTSSKKIKEDLLTATNQHIATIEPFATDQLQPILKASKANDPQETMQPNNSPFHSSPFSFALQYK